MKELGLAESRDTVVAIDTGPRRSPGKMLWWGAALIAAALLLGIAVSFGAGADYDKAVLHALAFRRATTPGLAIDAANAVTWLGDPGIRSVVLIAAALWLVWKRRRFDTIALLVTIGIATTANSLLKEIFARPRPDLVPHLDPVASLAYPSGHAANSALIYLSVALLLGGKRWLWAALLLTFVIGATRPLLGVHWPSDVIGGWLFGAGCALVGVGFARGAKALTPPR